MEAIISNNTCDFNGKQEKFPRSVEEAENLERQFQESTEPLPIQRSIADPQPYPFEALGDILGLAAKRMYEVIQAPDAICAQSVLSVASLCTQLFYNVVCDGREYPLSLNLLSVIDSGERKSAADDVALRPVIRWQKTLVSAFKSETSKFKEKEAVWERKFKEAISISKDFERDKLLDALGEKPDPPLAPLIICNEPTIEGLVQILQVGQPSFGVFSDEGGRLMTGYSAKENAGNLAGILSQIWDGKPIDRVRVKDGMSILYGKRLAIHLLMQPLFLSKIQKNDILREQGIMARFLIVYPRPMGGSRKYKSVDMNNEEAVRLYYAKIESLLDKEWKTKNDEGRELELAPLGIDKDAKELWIRFNDEYDAKIGKNGSLHSIKSMVSKSANQVLRIAGILTAFKHAHAQSVHMEEMQNALKLMKYYINEALRIEGASNTDRDLNLAQSVSDWLRQFKSEVQHS